MRQLCIETSNRPMSIALVEDGALRAQISTNGPLQHSTQLMPSIDYLCQLAGWQVEDLDQILVSNGPGSYTGLRIGVTIAKTLANSLKIELKAVSSLALIAENIPHVDGPIIAVMDARRRHVYWGAYKREAANEPVKTILPDTYGAITDVLSQLKKAYPDQPLYFAGLDLDVFVEEIKSTLGERAQLLPAEQAFPHAVQLAKLAESVPASDVNTLTPNYAKLAEAEENWQANYHDTLKEGSLVETRVE